MTKRDLTQKLLREALIKRLHEVIFSLPGSVTDAGQVSTSSNSSGLEDSEEALRLIMVKYFPRFEKRDFSQGDIDAYFRLLSQISPACLSDDLRYLDALNNAQELLAKLELSPEIRRKFLVPFLVEYRDILIHQIKRLENENPGLN